MYFFTLFVIYTSLYTLYSNPSPLYFTYQEAWPSSLAWKCSGTPILKGQRVQFIEEATKVYYDTLMSGRFIEDKDLDIVIPPNSILKSKDYLNMLNLVIHTSTKNFGNPVVMRINCELMNNLKWVKEVYNRALSRNTKIFRAILDIIYRLGLCFREIDPHLNCPDICRSKTDKFCKNKPYTVGFCGTYMNDLLSDANINYTEKKEVKELKRILKNWLLHVPVERRLPIEFFLHFISNKKLFVKAIEIQRQSSLIAYCPCEAKYVYDKISDTCSDIKGEHGCYSDSYCSNGGTCVQNLGMNHLESGLLCQCPPAFKGTQCEYERNPCEDKVGCAPFPCVRDPQNLEYGFRLGLCFREIDPHLNCPDICRSKTDKFCKNKQYTVGFCGTYTNDLLRDEGLHSKSDINISQTKREDLINAVKLCDLYSQQYVTSTSEYGLNEQLITVEEVDDRSTTGFQDAPQPHLNESIGTDQSQSANVPTRRDYLLTTGWIYVIVLHIGTILLWIHYIHRWRTHGRD
ncbi:hypothetical protein Smp_145730 [Schistosoma mansoni]|uniref:hypothetical protein n=1 Tax=Schistosoma mansoni TaxID=6183 RepID=UPI00022C81D5|nr:hypothetical protein Smp_145730 [Schistosoma mansoni]|eukprot:XP_018647389.1 hypothetical protein Smp_145730 [Schistosoma mansoni]